MEQVGDDDSEIRLSLSFFKATGIQRGHAGVADECRVAFASTRLSASFGESLVVAVVGVAVIPYATVLDGGFDLQACTEPVEVMPSATVRRGVKPRRLWILLRETESQEHALGADLGAGAEGDGVEGRAFVEELVAGAVDAAGRASTLS